MQNNELAIGVHDRRQRDMKNEVAERDADTASFLIVNRKSSIVN
jgi:hypothetical protein